MASNFALKIRAFILAVVPAFAGLAAEPSFDRDIRPLLETYCFKCHGAEKPKAGVNLSAFRDTGSVQRDPKTWEKVLTQLRDREMPPESKPQPKPEERDRLTEWVGKTLDSADFSKLPKDPGPAILHRLNRLEYNNTVRDLLGVNTRPAEKFPTDAGGGGGFDNNAATLYLPPILLEKFLAAADEIVRAAAPEKIFIAQPAGFSGKRGAARKIIEHFAMRAFRRPVEKDEVERLLGLYDQSVRRGATHEDAVRLTLKALLVSPNFLFRVEQDRPGKEPVPVDDFELASRLSYFLWSSMPDEELFRLAGGKKLRDPRVLEAQTRRMIQDAKSKTFAENFTSQWLGTRRLESSVQPDPGRFPTFTPGLRAAMQAEPVEFFHSLLREDASLLKLLDADYTFANADLAKLYGITNLAGAELRRVALTDRNRGGVLGMAGVLTLTSYPQRTSPVLRGKWVLEEIFGTPPPPPPSMVKSLPQDDKPKDGLTLRQRLEQHRVKPECAACHRRMDPLGFGLENFDAIGRWRTQISGQPVDARGELTTGEKFEGAVELKKILLEKKPQFVRNLTEKTLAYALGRGVEFYDIPTIRQLTATLAAKDYRSSTLIVEIVKSYQFQYRRPRTAEETAQTAEK